MLAQVLKYAYEIDQGKPRDRKTKGERCGQISKTSRSLSTSFFPCSKILYGLNESKQEVEALKSKVAVVVV